MLAQKKSCDKQKQQHNSSNRGFRDACLQVPKSPVYELLQLKPHATRNKLVLTVCNPHSCGA